MSAAKSLAKGERSHSFVRIQPPQPTPPLEPRAPIANQRSAARWNARAKQRAHKLVQVEGALWQAVYAGCDARSGAQAGSVDGDMLRPRAVPQRNVLLTLLKEQGWARGQAAPVWVRQMDATCASASPAQGGMWPRRCADGMVRAQESQTCEPIELRRQRSREASGLQRPVYASREKSARA